VVVTVRSEELGGRGRPRGAVPDVGSSHGPKTHRHTEGHRRARDGEQTVLVRVDLLGGRPFERSTLHGRRRHAPSLRLTATERGQRRNGQQRNPDHQTAARDRVPERTPSLTHARVHRLSLSTPLSWKPLLRDRGCGRPPFARPKDEEARERDDHSREDERQCWVPPGREPPAARWDLTPHRSKSSRGWTRPAHVCA